MNVLFQAVKEFVPVAGLASLANKPGFAHERFIKPFAGEVPHAAIPAHIAAMDVAVIPMAADYGSPTKTFEYMAMGRAVLAPAVPALREVLEDGRTARLTRPGSVGELAGAMRELADDPHPRPLTEAGEDEVDDWGPGAP